MAFIQKLAAPLISGLFFLVNGFLWFGNGIGNVSNDLMAIRYHNAQKNAIDFTNLSFFVNTVYFYCSFCALFTILPLISVVPIKSRPNVRFFP